MRKQEMLDYAERMEDDEQVFIIVYSKHDVAEWFRKEKHETMLPPEEDISAALLNWESNLDLSSTICLANDFDDLCEQLLDDEIKRTQ